MISRRIRIAGCLAVMFLAAANVMAQTPSAGASVSLTAVPKLINYGGVLKDSSGKTVTTISGVTFLIYKDEQGGTPLWFETQNVRPDHTGHYTVQLGAMNAHGLPADIFQSGEARWLAVQIAGEGEQARALLVAVPYAMKAQDAETIGGLPPSAFVLAVPVNTNGVTANSAATASPAASVVPQVSSNVTTTGGTTSTIPMFTTATNIQNSILSQTGTTVVNVKGKLNLPATGTATAASGKNSQVEDFVASAFSSGTSRAVAQVFQLQAEPAANNTATPSGTLNVLYGSGTTAPKETGLKISSKGLITFAAGQTFPGTGKGTVTSVGSGAGLTGGPITSTGTLSIATAGVTNAMLHNSSLTVAAGTALTGGGVVSLGGTTTLNLDATKVPLLALNNKFTGNNAFVGTVGVGTLAPGAQLEVDASSTAFGALTANGGSAPSGTNQTGSTGITANGGTGDLTNDAAGNGGAGLIANGGASTSLSGTGIIANGAFGQDTGEGGPGIIGTGGAGDSDGSGGIFSGGNFIQNGDGIDATAGSGLAGSFNGNVNVTGSISAGVKDFKIDHPLDPGNKYLVHASVESSEMMNIYTGNVTTDAQGEATVRLPEWFEVLNTDFRYQLTVIGQFAQAIVANEVQNHQFSIRTSAPNVKVSWQISGVRQDAYAKANPLVVEQEKEARLRGYYIHPELYGAPAEKQIEWARHPRLMKQAQESRLRMQARHPQPAVAPTH